MIRRNFLSMMSAVLFISSLIFCTPPTVTSTLAAGKSGPIKVGGLLPMTGPLLHQGPKVKEGIEMALDDAGWKVGGRKIEIVIEDSASNPTTALDKVRKLVERDKVIAVIGPQHSGVAKAIQPYMNKNRVISMKARQFPKALTARYPYLIVLDGTQQQVCAPMGWYAYEKLGYRKAITLGPDYIAGRAFLGGFMDGFKEKGGEIVQQQWFPVGNVDFAPYLSGLKPADAISAWVAGPGALRLISQYREYGVFKKMPMVGAFASSLIDEDMLPQLGDKALGILGPSSYASTLDNPINKSVIQRYKSRHGTPPNDSMMVGGYMNAYVLVQALKATNGDTNPVKLRKAMLGLKLKDTPIGPLSFTPEGSGIYNVYIVKVAKEADGYVWRVVHTYPNTQPR